MREFFFARTDARNLAVFRIVVFGTLLWAGYRTDVVAFTKIPTELRVAPTLYEGWMDDIPFGASFAAAARYVLLISSAMALAGLFWRCGAVSSCLSATYVLGVPYFFGKVDHVNHHLIWFAALLCVSRAGDAWSIDAWPYRLGLNHGVESHSGGLKIGGTARPRPLLALRASSRARGLLVEQPGTD